VRTELDPCRDGGEDCLEPRACGASAERAWTAARALVWSLLVTAAPGACGVEGARDSSQATVTDSAGIRVVESPDGSIYRVLTQEPVLAIGSVDGSDGASFGYVADGLLSPDRGVAVADQLAQAVLVFDSSGARATTWGGPGQGPGEYGMITRLDRYRGDSVLVTEIGSHRLSVLSRTGVFGRLITPRPRLDARPGFESVSSCCIGWGAETEGGGLLMGFPELIPLSGPAPRWSVVRLVRTAAEGDAVADYGSFRGGRYGVSTDAPTPLPYHYNNAVSIAPRDVGFGVTDGLSHEVRFHGANGRLETVGRILRPRAPVTDRMRAATEAYFDRERARIGEAMAEGAGFDQLRSGPYPDSLPAYTVLLLDEAGNAWAGSFHAPRLEQSARFDVFATDGRFLGSVLVPFEGRVLDVHAGHLLAVVRDELDVQYVQVYGLVAPVGS